MTKLRQHNCRKVSQLLRHPLIIKFFSIQVRILKKPGSSGKRKGNTYSYGFRYAITVKIYSFCRS